MKSKIKNFVIPLLLMFITNLGYYYLTSAPNLSGYTTPHMGILFIAGLFFGPYGILGAVIGNFICDFIKSYSIPASIVSEIISFAISYLAYKLWYTKNLDKIPITKPRLNSFSNIVYLLIIILICSTLYSILTANITEIFYPGMANVTYVAIQYFISFVNFSLIYSIILMIISRYYDFAFIPETSDKSYDKKEYKVLFGLIIITTLISILANIFHGNTELCIIETITIVALLLVYIRKPIMKVDKISYISIPEKIMIYFIFSSVVMLVLEMIIFSSPMIDNLLNMILEMSEKVDVLLLIALDYYILLLITPSLILLGYVEKKVIKPLISISKIEGFIRENEKIESEGLINIYSDYLDNDDEIGILSRSYTKLIKNNNNYIENVKSLESEKERINTELNIAQKLQASTLPVKSIDNEEIKIEGYSKPAKEVGGDFYDFYELDEENTVIMIGDASGKGIPAAIFTMLTQNSIKLLMKNELDPAKVLCDVNNQICENNPEMMFITLFLGIYNNKKHCLTYANAGHNPPIIKRDNKHQLLDIDSEIVLGVLENYAYENHAIKIEEELLLYTDGITDARNNKQVLYGEDRLIDCLNNQESDKNMIIELINDVDMFTEKEAQFDDMTLLLLKVK